MYETALTIHSLLRLATTLIVLAAIIGALKGWFARTPRTPGDNRMGLLATIVVDAQFLLGLLLYLVWSPVTKQAMSDFGAAMKEPQLRHFAVEHPVMMVGAIGLIHAGKLAAKAGATDAAKHRRTAIFFTLALVLILVGSPWPIGPYERPWVRLGG